MGYETVGHRLKPQHTSPLQQHRGKCHFIPALFVVTVCLCDPLLCLCAFSFLNFTPAKLCDCFLHGCSAFVFAKSDRHIEHLAKALRTAAVDQLHFPAAHFGTLHFDIYIVHVKFPDCILHGRPWWQKPVNRQTHRGSTNNTSSTRVDGNDWWDTVIPSLKQMCVITIRREDNGTFPTSYLPTFVPSCSDHGHFWILAFIFYLDCTPGTVSWLHRVRLWCYHI